MLIYYSDAQSSIHESNDLEEYGSEGIQSNVLQDDGSSNEEDVDGEPEEQQTILEPTFEMSPTLNNGGFSPTTRDVDMNTNEVTVPPSPQVSASIPSIKIPQTGLGVIDEPESGRGRRKRALRHISDLNGCLCGRVVNLGVDSRGIIECKQAGCETQWVCSTVHGWTKVTYIKFSIIWIV